MTTRTQEEILARIEAVAEDDFMGFRRVVLIDALDYEHAKPFLQPGVTAESWSQIATGADRAEARAHDYYAFALGKIAGHRGLSASRSVDKLGEYAWLLGRDDALAAMEAADYEQYGAPKVRAFGTAFGLDWPDDPAMQRMAEGRPCTDDCAMGCGR